MRNSLIASVLLATLAFAQQAPKPAVHDHQPVTAAPANAGAREKQIAEKALALRPKLVEMRRDLHMHPELSNREERTARVVAERLKELGFTDVKTGVAKHGVVALLKGGKPGPVIAVRADMDALPITETMNVPYKSKNVGVKHACGHDLHTAVQLAVAEILAGMKDQIPGTIKFIFQPAEEGPPDDEEGGAPLMIKQGVLESPRPEAIFALHVMPTIEVGEIGITAGGAMASSDKFVITIRGKGVHAAYPHQGLDPIVTAAEAVTALQTIRSRRITTLQPLVLSIGKITGGTRNNIIPDEVVMEGTLRTLDEGVRAEAKQLMKQILDGVTGAHGATYAITWPDSNYVTYNDPNLTVETKATLQRVLGEDKVRERLPQMGAEDFSAFQQVIPGHYFFLGVGNKQKGITAMFHTAEFDIDEDSLVVGTKAMANVLLDYLERHAGAGAAQPAATAAPKPAGKKK